MPSSHFAWKPCYNGLLYGLLKFFSPPCAKNDQDILKLCLLYIILRMRYFHTICIVPSLRLVSTCRYLPPLLVTWLCKKGKPLLCFLSCKTTLQILSIYNLQFGLCIWVYLIAVTPQNMFWRWIFERFSMFNYNYRMGTDIVFKPWKFLIVFTSIANHYCQCYCYTHFLCILQPYSIEIELNI